MGEYVLKLPDAGEGVAEAELVEWCVEIGGTVTEDDLLAVVMTDKANVEIRSPVDGKVRWLGADVGDLVAVGAPLLRLEVEGEGNVSGDARALEPEAPPEPVLRFEVEGEDDVSGGAGAPEPVLRLEVEGEDDLSGDARAPEPAPPPAGGRGRSERAPTTAGAGPRRRSPGRGPAARARRPEGERPIAAPSVRRRAREAGVDLRQVPGSGPAGRITHDDLDAWQSGGVPSGLGRVRARDTSVEEVRIVGLRRRIAERLAIANARIPHITYVEEVDMTALEQLRESLNADRHDGQPRLTVLPFLVRAMVNAIRRQPVMNAHYDDEAGVLRQYGGVHVGVATQTPEGLLVPVVRHVEALDVWECAAAVARIAELARTGAAPREDLSGSTITITSLGRLGGLVTTPIVNPPEVAIVGVNRLQVRPVWDGRGVVPRQMMNLSSSFDHRIVDGMDAAVFVQAIKRQLESPATLFIGE